MSKKIKNQTRKVKGYAQFLSGKVTGKRRLKMQGAANVLLARVREVL